MPAVVAVVGHSRSGKTSLLERLIPELRRRGHRIAAIKHTHKDVQADRAGKDSWRLAEAGAEVVALAGSGTLATFRRPPTEPTLEELLRLVVGDCDLVLIEGLHAAQVPKIEVYRKAVGPDLRTAPDELLAVVTDEPLDVTCPRLSPEDTTALADLIAERVLGARAPETVLWINGAPIPIGSFSQRIIASTLEGLVSTLKGVDEVNDLEVHVRTGKDRTGPAGTE